MIDESSRRHVLRTAGAVCSGGLIGGCVLGGDDGPAAGDLLIRNTDSEAHTVAVTVEKTNENDDGVPPGPRR
ncbi:hypothetical protein C475_04925 [Halosimplex carlsbadense 2-9-1]|uniref:Uncharacterized protein n=1 Tax=Halosimplex carlsbadense 2-9-1 TaxID=797114 RepID=M0CY29_9EURY|nr:hypothetical protein [Halosimplex carlsbadense]ELZ28120.1 hypothetical protein C475_04925 [Halosimplex carlsbadense 2-9-1]